MTNFKGTKGKWVWYPQRGNELATLENEYGSEICNFGNDTCYYPTEGVEPNEYDKKLIACAPEMLEMLEKIVAITENFEITSKDFQEKYNEEIEQLIKKATE